jgi:hypothetical protein
MKPLASAVKLILTHLLSLILVVLTAQAVLPGSQSLYQSFFAAVFVALWILPLTAFIHVFQQFK